MKDKSIDGPAAKLPDEAIAAWADWNPGLEPREPLSAKQLGFVRTAFMDGFLAAWNTRSNNAPALVEALQEAIDALEGKVSNLDDVICCSGHDCGCLGSSHRDLLVHNIHAVLSTALGEMNDA